MSIFMFLPTIYKVLSWTTGKNRTLTHPDSGLGEVGPHGDLLPSAHVRVAVPGERGLQFLQLLGGKVGPLPALPLLPAVLVRLFGSRCHGLISAQIRDDMAGRLLLLLLGLVVVLLLMVVVVLLVPAISSTFLL